MRRIPRRSVDVFVGPYHYGHLRSSVSICAACRLRRRQAPSTAFSTTSSIRQQQDKPLDRSEKVRRWIWGTDKPPGRIDPYDPNSPFRVSEEDLKAAEEARAKNRELALPPSELERRRKQEKLDAAYEPATTWEGLEWVGDKAWQEKLKGPVAPTERFGGEVRQLAYDDVRRAMLTALVDVFTGPDSRHGSFALDESIRADLLHAYQYAITGARTEANGSKTLEDGSLPSSQSRKGSLWRDISLADPVVKFRVVRRVVELSGIRISDPILNASGTAGSLFNRLLTKPKPAKLAETIVKTGALSGLANVKFSGRRVTPVEKEKQVGRWKVIHQELVNRGLPVYRSEK